MRASWLGECTVVVVERQDELKAWASNISNARQPHRPPQTNTRCGGEGLAKRVTVWEALYQDTDGMPGGIRGTRANGDWFSVPNVQILIMLVGRVVFRVVWAAAGVMKCSRTVWGWFRAQRPKRGKVWCVPPYLNSGWMVEELMLSRGSAIPARSLLLMSTGHEHQRQDGSVNSQFPSFRVCSCLT